MIFKDGLIDLDLNDVSLSFLPVPGVVQDELQPLVDRGLGINEALSESGAAVIQSFEMVPGRVVIVGIHNSGATVSALTIENFKEKYQSAAAGLEGFSKNFPCIVETPTNELEPDAVFYIKTRYNPFNLGLGIPFEDFSNRIVVRLNGIIAENANHVGAKLADPYDLMGGRAAAWTNLLQGDIHPNSNGYLTLAYSLAQAR